MIVYYWDAGMKRSDSYSSVTTSGRWLLGCPTDLTGFDLPLVIICKLENLLYITEEEYGESGTELPGSIEGLHADGRKRGAVREP